MDKNNMQVSATLVSLMKGVIYEATQPKLWQTMLENQIRIEDYVSQLGLTMVVQGQDGYAYLKQMEQEAEGNEIPHLIVKRQLSFSVSLLLALLRKELIEMQKNGGETRCILSKEEIIERMRPYMKTRTDEIKQRKEIEAIIKKVEEMQFLRSLQHSTTAYEILPLVRGFVDAQWLESFNEKLQEYMDFGANGAVQEEVEDGLI